MFIVWCTRVLKEMGELFDLAIIFKIMCIREKGRKTDRDRQTGIAGSAVPRAQIQTIPSSQIARHALPA